MRGDRGDGEDAGWRVMKNGRGGEEEGDVGGRTRLVLAGCRLALLEVREKMEMEVVGRRDCLEDVGGKF